MSTFSHDAVRILGSHKETIDGALYCEYRELTKTIVIFVLSTSTASSSKDSPASSYIYFVDFSVIQFLKFNSAWYIFWNIDKLGKQIKSINKALQKHMQ